MNFNNLKFLIFMDFNFNFSKIIIINPLIMLILNILNFLVELFEIILKN